MMPSSVPVHLLEWSACPDGILNPIDRGVGCLGLDSNSNHGCVLSISSDVFRLEFCIDSSTSIRRDGDSTIILAAAGSCAEYVIVFTDSVSCGMVWVALYVLLQDQVNLLVDPPTLDNISFLRQYLASVHPILRALVASSVARPGFLRSFYDIFAQAEHECRFDVLPLFREITISLFHLNNNKLTSMLLSAQNIDNTIACMEYDSTMGEITSYQTTHRKFLSQTKLHCVLPSLHDRFEALARTNYRIVYLKNAVAGHRLNANVMSSIDSIVASNCCSIADALLSDRSFVKKLTGAVIPVMVSLNGSLIHSAAAHEPALRFLTELLALPIPETAMRRLVRKLCGGRLMDLLDHAFASSNESSTQCGVLDVLSALQSVSSDRFYEHVFSADGQLVPAMINRLTDSSQPSVASDRSIEFLQSLIPTFDPFAVNSELVAAVDDMVGSMLPLLIGSLQRGQQSIGKLSKVSDFVGWLIQTRPDLCRTRFGGSVTWFVSLADRVLIDLDLSAQQKHLRMSSARLLSQAASVSDDWFVRAMLNRSGMLESVLLMLLSNSGSEGMFGSVMQGMLCTMAEHWLNSFLSGRASSLVERIGSKSSNNALRQINVSLSIAISNVIASLDTGAASVSGSSAPSIIRASSLELYQHTVVPEAPTLPAVDDTVHAFASTSTTMTCSSISAMNRQLDDADTSTNVLQDSLHDSRSKNDSIALQLKLVRSQFAAQRVTDVLHAVRFRLQKSAFGRWKKSNVISKPNHPLDLAHPDPVQEDSFLMDALCALAWQRKLDRSRAIALVLRLSLMPMLRRKCLAQAMSKLRGLASHQNPPNLTFRDLSDSGDCSGLDRIVPVHPTSVPSFCTSDSHSSFGAAHHASLTSSSTSTVSIGSPIDCTPLLIRAPSELGEMVADSFVKRSDSQLHFTINAANYDSVLCRQF